MRDIVESTAAFEDWLRSLIRVNESDIAVKHRKMSEDVFQFMRATFYRWVELWPEHCPELANGLQVMAVGDLHLQNFGTWRDNEGRLVWGVNDLDEAGRASFAIDLVRTGASVALAISQTPYIKLPPDEAYPSILKGYLAGVEAGGVPFVLERRNSWLLRLARNALKEPKIFWKRWLEMKTEPIPAHSDIPDDVAQILRRRTPGNGQAELRWTKRGVDPKGLGSLGHQRYFAYTEWLGGPVAREAKSCAPSALLWAKQAEPSEIHIMDLLKGHTRPVSPHSVIESHWLIRPIMAECGRIELAEIDLDLVSRDRIVEDERRLLEAIGFETANVHLASTPASDLAKAASGLTPKLFQGSIAAMVDALTDDFKKWRKHWKNNTQPPADPKGQKTPSTPK